VRSIRIDESPPHQISPCGITRLEPLDAVSLVDVDPERGQAQAMLTYERLPIQQPYRVFFLAAGFCFARIR
jgi:phage terminase large subunit-like protein